MNENARRLDAVLKALRGVRAEVQKRGHRWWDSEVSDRWVRTLGGFGETDIESLSLGKSHVYYDDYLTHLDASITFLEVYEVEEANGEAPNGLADAIDAEYSDVTGTNAAANPNPARWFPRLIKPR